MKTQEVTTGLRVRAHESFTEGGGETPEEIIRVHLKVLIAGINVFDANLDFIDGKWRKLIPLLNEGHCIMTATSYDKQNIPDTVVIEGEIVKQQSNRVTKFIKPTDEFEIPTGTHEIIVEATVTQPQKKKRT